MAMLRVFSLHRGSIQERSRHLHRVLSQIRGAELKTLRAVDFTGCEYLDNSGWKKAITMLLWTPGVYVWHRDDVVRCVGKTTKGCWPRLHSGFAHEHIRPDTVLPRDGFAFFPCKGTETTILEIDLIRFFDPPFGRRQDGVWIYNDLLEQVGAWHPRVISLRRRART